MDSYVRTKTKALILKYALAHPDSQRAPAERADGTVGGVGLYSIMHLVQRAQREGLRCVRMEALNLKLYLSACKLKFESIASKLPPMPAPSSAHSHSKSNNDTSAAAPA
eukprot:945630-Pyramimonas_sp.AAC.1